MAHGGARPGTGRKKADAILYSAEGALTGAAEYHPDHDPTINTRLMHKGLGTMAATLRPGGVPTLNDRLLQGAQFTGRFSEPEYAESDLAYVSPEVGYAEDLDRALRTGPGAGDPAYIAHQRLARRRSRLRGSI